MNEIDVFGIDLGTTNSAISVWEPESGRSKILHNSEGERLTPSVVMFDRETMEAVVGKEAVTKMSQTPDEVVYSVKRFIGCTFRNDWVCDDKANVTYCIKELDNKKVGISIGEQTLTSAQISAKVLEKIKKDAEGMLGGKKITKAVITVPAYFNESQRQATKEAGELAGLRVPRIINEPTAAALAFGLGADPQIVAVYDMGGGTFDISILQISHGLFRVKATGGDTHLGGNDFDMAIVNFFQTEFENKHKKPLPVKEDNIIRARLREEAEKAKIALSKAEIYEVKLKDILKTENKSFDLELTLTRIDLENLIQPLINKSLDICEHVLKKAKLTHDKINQVLLVGGQTRSPSIKSAIRERFDWKINDTINPDEVVARGAAVLGARLCDHLKEQVKLWDVIPLSLGIELYNEQMDVIVPANNPIPVTKWRNGPHAFTTQRDGQEQIVFHIYQGERPVAKDNFWVGKVELKLTTPRQAGEHRINCMFKVDHDGILHVRAEDAETEGEPIEATFDHIYRLTEKEVEEIQDEAEAHKAEDETTRRLFEITEELTRFKKGFKKDRTDDKLKQVLEEIETAIQERNVDRAYELLKTLTS